MSEQTVINTLSGGVQLMRHYSQGEDPNTACGNLALWGQIITELRQDSFGYYDNLDGSNKFLKHVSVHVYSQSLPYPDAHIGGQVTYNLGGGYSKITCPFTDPSQYWFKAAMSHEFGHAYDNWMRLYSDPNIQAVRDWWEKEITLGYVLYVDSNPSYPWKRSDGGIERPWEQFANSWRILFGTPGTRNNAEEVVPGFVNTTTLTNLKKQLLLLPETLAMAIAYGGIKPNTFSWESNCWMFQIPSGYWIAQTDYNVWWFWNGGKWTRWTPTYSRD